MSVNAKDKREAHSIKFDLTYRNKGERVFLFVCAGFRTSNEIKQLPGWSPPNECGVSIANRAGLVPHDQQVNMQQVRRQISNIYP